MIHLYSKKWCGSFPTTLRIRVYKTAPHKMWQCVESSPCDGPAPKVYRRLGPKLILKSDSYILHYFSIIYGSATTPNRWRTHYWWTGVFTILLFPSLLFHPPLLPFLFPTLHNPLQFSSPSFKSSLLKTARGWDCCKLPCGIRGAALAENEFGALMLKTTPTFALFDHLWKLWEGLAKSLDRLLKAYLRVARESKFPDPTQPTKAVTRPDPLIYAAFVTRPGFTLNLKRR